MPSSSIVAAESLLPCGEGWIAAGSVKNADVWGIDRHGLPTKRMVKVSEVRQSTSVIFLGTAVAFGPFAPASKVHLYGGGKMSLANLVADGIVGEKRFESWLDWGGRSISVEGKSAIWKTLVVSSAFHDGVMISMRQRGKSPKKSTGSVWSEMLKYGDRTYWRTTKGKLEEALDKDWRKTLQDLAEIWGVDEEGAMEFERAEYGLVIWLICALRKGGHHAELLYDSLQHTAILRLRNVKSHANPTAKGGCCFIHLCEQSEYSVKWDDPTWAPVCNGFLLAGE